MNCRPQKYAAALAAVFMIAGPSLQAADSVPNQAPEVRIDDVALQNGGRLTGRAVDVNGKAMPGVPVVFRYNNRTIVSTRSASDGSFHIQGLRPGVHKIDVGKNASLVRLWTGGGAPPNARTKIVMVSDRVIRANAGVGALGGLSPGLVVGLGAGAVAGVVAGAVSYDRGKEKATHQGGSQSP